jgi:hypothetical protein
LQSLALDLKCEFLPEEYTVAAIARDWAQPVDVTQRALDELTGKTGLKRPIINTLEVSFDEEEPVTLVRVRGAREKQPVGWKDESDLARVWNETYPGDQIVTVDFERRVVNRRLEEGGSQLKSKSGVQQMQSKRIANAVRSSRKRNRSAAQPLDEVLATVPHLPDSREEKTREENTDVRSANVDGAAPELPTGSASAATDDGNSDGPGAKLKERFDDLIVGWGEPKTNGDHDPRKRAMMFLSADPPRLFANVLDINDNPVAYKRPWDELGKRLARAAMPKKKKYHTEASEIIGSVTG